MRALLLQLYSTSQSPSSSPFSIEVLGGHLQRYLPHCQVTLDTIVDGKKSLEKLHELLRTHTPDLVGLSVMQGTFPLAMRLLEDLHAPERGDDGPQVVLGNALPTNTPLAFLSRFPRALIVRGFGEDALLAILRVLEGTPRDRRLAAMENIPGIAMIVAGELHTTPVEWPREYGLPTWVDPDRYFARIEASRGCHYDKCTFCTRPPREADQAVWVRYPVAQVAGAIGTLASKGVQRFTFCDEDFIGDDAEGCFELCDLLDKLERVPPFSFSTRVDNIVKTGDTEENNRRRRLLFERLKRAGLSLVFVGTESFCNAQLKRYGKSATVENNVAAIELLREMGLSIEAGLMTFDPFLTMEELQENVETIDRHELWRETTHTLTKLRVQANTPMQQWVERAGLVEDFDENQMSYGYRFRDSTIARVAEICSRWKRDTDYLYRLVRNAQRMAIYDSFANDVVLDAKRLNFEFLKQVTASAFLNFRTLADITAEMKVRRRETVEALTATTDSPNMYAATSDALRREISGFLEVRS